MYLVFPNYFCFRKLCILHRKCQLKLDKLLENNTHTHFKSKVIKKSRNSCTKHDMLIPVIAQKDSLVLKTVGLILPLTYIVIVL